MAAVALICIALASCGSDDGKNSTKKEPKKLSGAEISYKTNVTGTIYEVCDVFVDYYDANGQVQTEKVNENWSKTFTVKKFPANLGISISLKRKDGVPATENSYTIETTPSITFTGIATDGSKIGTPSSVASQRFISSPLASMLDEYIERIGNSISIIRNLHISNDNTELYFEIVNE